MTRLAIGAQLAGRLAGAAKQLAAEFKTLLVRTYSTALSNYRDQQIDYKPLRAKADDTRSPCRSDVKPSGSSQPVSIDYEMEKDSRRVESLRRQGGRGEPGHDLPRHLRERSSRATAWTA